MQDKDRKAFVASVFLVSSASRLNRRFGRTLEPSSGQILSSFSCSFRRFLFEMRSPSFLGLTIRTRLHSDCDTMVRSLAPEAFERLRHFGLFQKNEGPVFKVNVIFIITDGVGLRAW